MQQVRSVRSAMGHKIRTFRKLREITQVDLATQLGYTSTGTLSQIEAGERGMDLEKLPKAAAILGVPMAVLMADIDMAEEEAKLLVKLLDLIKNKNKSEEMRSYYLAVKKILV